jgi:hypothetical protein
LRLLITQILLALIVTSAWAEDTPAVSVSQSVEGGAVDRASDPPPVPKPLPKERLDTRISGRWRSELLMSERPRIRHLGDGRYARDTTTVYPFYNTLNLRADEIGHKGLSLHFQGWAGLDLADVYFEERMVADPTYLYLQFRHMGFDLRVGRQQTYLGAARGVHLDGVFFSYQSPINLGLQALGGLLVTPKHGPDWYRGEEGTDYEDYGSGFSDWKSEGQFGDWAAGGRVFYRMAGVVSAGLSILHRSLKDDMAFEEAGADIDVVPAKWVTLSGDALLSVAGVGLKEATANVDFYPIEALTIGLDYRHADPTLYIPNTSIFSVFSDERYDAVGGAIYGRPHRQLTLHAAYHHLFYTYLDKTFETDTREANYEDQLDTGYDVGGGATWRWGDKGGSALFNYRRFDQDQNGMHQIHAGTVVPLLRTELRATANLYVEIYDTAVAKNEAGLFGDIGLMWKRDGWETGGTFTAGMTPYADHEIRGILKVAYNWDIQFIERRHK